MVKSCQHTFLKKSTSVASRCVPELKPAQDEAPGQVNRPFTRKIGGGFQSCCVCSALRVVVCQELSNCYSPWDPGTQVPLATRARPSRSVPYVDCMHWPALARLWERRARCTHSTLKVEVACKNGAHHYLCGAPTGSCPSGRCLKMSVVFNIQHCGLCIAALHLFMFISVNVSTFKRLYTSIFCIYICILVIMLISHTITV